MGSLPGPSGRDTVSAPFHTGEAETYRPEVSEPGPVAGGDGESGKYQTQPSIGPSDEGDSAEKTPGQNNTVRRFMVVLWSHSMVAAPVCTVGQTRTSDKTAIFTRHILLPPRSTELKTLCLRALYVFKKMLSVH